MGRDANDGPLKVHIRLAGFTTSLLSASPNRLTIFVVHLLDLEDILSPAEVVMVELVPASDGGDLRTGELRKWGDEEAVYDEDQRIAREREQCRCHIVFQ